MAAAICNKIPAVSGLATGTNNLPLPMLGDR